MGIMIDQAEKLKEIYANLESKKSKEITVTENKKAKVIAISSGKGWE